MTKFQRFQNLNSTKHIETQKAVNSHFLIQGYPSIKISSVGQNSIETQAVVVNQQEKDYSYIYTYEDSPLLVGSVWTAKNLHLLISEEITVIKDVKWHKYKAFNCNIELDGIWGLFIGSEKAHIDLKQELKAIYESSAKPILILPENTLNFKDKIILKGRAWMVEEFDSISSPGITYYSLQPTTISKMNEEEVIERAEDPVTPVIINPIEEEDNVSIAHNIDITISTKEGYFKTSNKQIKIKRRTANEVIFNLPFGVNETTIEYKDSSDVIITKRYKAVD